MTSNQPICFPCWNQRNPGRDPVRVLKAERLTCCYCGYDTYEGIFVRVDPATVRYPRRDP